MKVLQLVARRQLRGAEVFAAQLGERLAAHGLDVVLAGLYPPREPAPAPRGVRQADLAPEPTSRLDWRPVRALAALLDRERFDLVQANGSDTLKYSVLARAWSGRTVPIVYRNISVMSHWLRGPLHRRFNRWLLSRIERVVAVSETSRQDVVERLGYPAACTATVPIGVELPAEIDRTAAWRRLSALVPLEPETPLLVHVGSFTPEKDHATLLEACRRLAASHPQVRTVLVGDGPLKERIAAEAALPPLAGRVHLVGARADASELMAAADLLVLSSRVEGIPGVLLEAAARGVPAVATHVGAVHEAIDDGRTGLLVPPGDPAALGAAVGRLLDDPDERRALGAAARERVRRDFDLERITDRFLDLYRELGVGLA